VFRRLFRCHRAARPFVPTVGVPSELPAPTPTQKNPELSAPGLAVPNFLTASHPEPMTRGSWYVIYQGCVSGCVGCAVNINIVLVSLSTERPSTNLSYTSIRHPSTKSSPFLGTFLQKLRK